jgi:hypothetical protein
MKSAGICKTASWRELTDLYIISNAPLLLMFLPLYTATRRRVEEEEEEDTHQNCFLLFITQRQNSKLSLAPHSLPLRKGKTYNNYV